MLFIGQTRVMFLKKYCLKVCKMLNFKVISAFKFIDLNLWYQPIHFWIFEAQYAETP